MAASKLSEQADVALKSSVSLLGLISVFKSSPSPRSLCELERELNKLAKVLLSIRPLNAKNIRSLACLEIALIGCWKACNGVEEMILSRTVEPNGLEASFQDWKHVLYMGYPIDGVKNIICNYRRTISIAFRDTNLNSITDTIFKLSNHINHLRGAIVPEEVRAREIVNAVQCINICSEIINSKIQRNEEKMNSTEKLHRLDVPAENAISYDKIISGPVFQFLIGKEKEPMTIHTDLVAKQSPALQILVSGCMVEAQTGTVEWEDVDVPTFGRFAEFCYTGNYTPPVRIPCTSTSGAYIPCGGNSDTTWNGKDEKHKEKAPEMVDSPVEDYTPIFLGHARLYVLAEKYGVDKLKVTVLQKLRNTLRCYTTCEARDGDIAELVRYTYENTPTVTSIEGLRELVIRYVATEAKEIGVSLVADGGPIASDVLSMIPEAESEIA